MKKFLRISIVCIALAALLGLEEYFRWIGPFLKWQNQVANAANFGTVRGELIEYYEDHGEYPMNLADGVEKLSWFDGRDSWGNRILYMSDGRIFIMVSLGKDGRPDGTNYLAARLKAPIYDSDPACSEFKTDQILTDRGWYRACGK